MFDTTIVNYGINKLQSAFKSVQPELEGLTQQFIEYTVMKQVLNYIAVSVALVLLCLLWVPVYRYGKNKGEYTTNFEEPWFIIPTVFLGLGMMICGVFIVTEFSNTVLAIIFPEMFAIKSMIKP